MNSLSNLTADAYSVLQTAADKSTIAKSLELVSQLKFKEPQNDSHCLNFNNNIKNDPELNIRNDDDGEDEDYDDGASAQDYYNCNIDEPLLSNQDIAFNLQTPPIVPNYLNYHYVCESGSRLLFLSVYWIKKVPAFKLFNEETQVTILRTCWVELFAVGLAQCAQSLSLDAIMSSMVQYLKACIEEEKILPQKIKRMSEHICKLQEFLHGMAALELDDYEFAYLKMITIFNSGENNICCVLWLGLTIFFTLFPGSIGISTHHRPKIERIQEIALIHLKNYCKQKSTLGQSISGGNQNTSSRLGDRFTKMLLRLTSLRALDSEVFEDLFFTNLIGQIEIDNVIPYILRLGGAGVSNYQPSPWREFLKHFYFSSQVKTEN